MFVNKKQRRNAGLLTQSEFLLILFTFRKQEHQAALRLDVTGVYKT